jgi:hypothetical protein
MQKRADNVAGVCVCIIFTPARRANKQARAHALNMRATHCTKKAGSLCKQKHKERERERR